MAKVLSIEISNSVIRMVEMDYKKKNPRVYRHAVVPTPPGSIKDGYVHSMTALRDVIKSALEEYKMKGTKEVIFTIASSKIVTREVILPAVKQPNQLGGLIKTNLNEYFPIDLSTYEIAHLVLERFAEGPDVGKYRTMIMAADKNLVSGYDELATMCGLRLISLDYAGNSIFQAVKREETANRVMVLKIEGGQTTISIIKNKNLMLQRSVNYGLSDAIEEVTKQPVFGVVGYDDAWELLKRKTCIKFNVSETAQRNSLNKDLSTDIETRDFDESQEIREAKIEVTKSLDTFLNSIRRVIEFYASRNAGEEVDRILITGSGGAMSGLSKLMTNELGIKTTVMNRLEGVGYIITNDDAGIFNFVSCIGATFEPVGFINKEKKAASKKETDFTGASVLIGFATILIVAALILISYMEVQDAKAEEQDLLALEETYKKSEQVYISYTNMLTLLEEVKEGDAKTLRPNDNILKFIEELEAALPADVEIDTFTSNDKQVVMSMTVANKETAVGVIQSLREFESLLSVSIPGVAEITDKEEEAEELDEGEVAERKVTFTLTAVYKPVTVEEKKDN